VAWRGNTWLATLTVMRSGAQGEFTEAEMADLEALHPHFQCVIRRLAGSQESRLVSSSLGRFISALPTASIVLDWNLRPLHFSSLAAQLCSRWRQEARTPHLKAPRRFQVPGDILGAIELLRPALTRLNRTGARASRRPWRLVHPHPKIGWLSADVEFHPSRRLSLSKGTFLVTVNEKRAGDAGAAIAAKVMRLTPRERECATLAAEGMQNNEIARRLGKSTITVRNQLTAVYKKLELDSRHKLITAFARLEAATGKNSKVVPALLRKRST
jgi:DNA-binding CsgD family transcriptional regulator